VKDLELTPIPAAVRLTPSPLKHFGMLAICIAFVAIGVLARGDNPALMWLVSGFFGLGAVVFIINLIPGSSFLELTAQGFTFRALYRTWHVPWTDVDGFLVANVGGRDMVCWNYAPGYDKQKFGRRLSSGLSGVEAGLPDTYGRSAGELAQLLNDWRQRHADRLDPP